MGEDESSVYCSAPSRHRPEPLPALARSSRFTAHEIKLMYRGFKQECPSGVVDEEMFTNIFSQFFPLGDATLYAHLVFNTIKHKQTGKVNFEEFLSILSRVARGSLQEKLSWVFSLYDVDGDGAIRQSEMATVARAVFQLLGSDVTPPCQAPDTAAREHVENVFRLMDTNCDGVVTLEELCSYVTSHPELMESLFSLDTVI